MPIVKIEQITAWSYSRYSDYDKCPFLAKCKHVDKRKEPDNPAMANGSATHTDAEQYTLGKLKKLPTSLERFLKEFAALRKQPSVLVEQQWCFNRQWDTVDWFARDAWLRIKVDAHYLTSRKVGRGLQSSTCYIIDHKTGREHDDHSLQRDLYALGALLVYPDLAVVQASHWYLDQGTIRTTKYTADDLERLQREWVDRTHNMLADTRFAPNPGNHCRWCHFSKAKAGPCKF